MRCDDWSTRVLPLKALTRESVDAALEPGRPVIVYCWDAL